MIYGCRQRNNGKDIGFLIFTTGKRVVLNAEEKAEFDDKIRIWQAEALLRKEEK